MLMRLVCTVLFLLTSGCATPSTQPATGGENPRLTAYAPLRSALEDRLDAALAGIGAPIDGDNTPAAARLWSADSRLGPWLLSSGFREARTNMAALRELGVGQIDIAVAYPILTGDEDRADEYRAVYGEIADEARSQGLGLRLISGPQYRDAYRLRGYPTRSQCGEDPVAALAAHARAVIEVTRPDYLTLDISPSTLAIAGDCAEFSAPVVAADLALRVVAELGPLGRTRIGIAARASEDPAFFAALLASKLDFYLDVAVFRLSGESESHIAALEALLASARQDGKDVAIGSYWLQKTAAVTDSGYLGIGYSSRDAAADTLDIWEPLDRRMHQLMRALTRHHGLLYASAYRSDLLFAYLPATEVLIRDYAPVNLLRMERTRSREAQIAYLRQLAAERRGST